MSGWDLLRGRIMKSPARRSMQKEYFCEIVDGGVKYYSADERRGCVVAFVNGVAHAGGQLINPQSSRVTSSRSWFNPVLHFGYVLGYDESHGKKLYVFRHEVGRFHHSTIFSGRPVIDAGMFSILNGRIAYIEHKSGHYKPNFEQLKHTLMCLKLSGVDLQRVYVSRYIPTPSLLDPVTPDWFDICLENGTAALHLASDVLGSQNYNAIPKIAVAGDEFFEDVTRVRWPL